MQIYATATFGPHYHPNKRETVRVIRPDLLPGFFVCQRLNGEECLLDSAQLALTWIKPESTKPEPAQQS